MYDFIVSRLSPELMTQVVYIQGAPYLPVFEFLAEVFATICTMAFGALVIWVLLFMVCSGGFLFYEWRKHAHENSHRV